MLPLAARASRCLAAEKALELGALHALRGEWGRELQKRSLQSASGPLGGDLTTGTAAGDAVASGPVRVLLDAFSPVENLGGGFDPTVFGTSIWEIMHSGTGLPWWASIPLTTLAVRTALLPLTVKARGATVNFALMRQATATSAVLWQRMQQEQEQAESSSSSSGGGTGKGGAAGGGSKQLTRNQLTKQYLMYMRRHHNTPSLWWYTANALVQINVFLSMSAALRRMSAAMWPGFDSEGLLWFADMTKPAIEWGTWATGYGVAGALLPLAVFGAYIRTLEYTSFADRPRGRALMELGCFPMFLAALVVPHATVLYWATNGAFNLGLQAALSRPKLAGALGLPMSAVYARGEASAAVKAELERRHLLGAVDASDDPGFVSYLASDTMARGQYAAALACLRRLTALQPQNAAAWRQLGAAAGRLGQWAAAGEAHERAAGLMLSTAQGQTEKASSSSSSSSGGGGQAVTLAEAGAEYIAGAVAYLNAASIPTAAAGAAAAAEAGAAAAAGGGSTGKLAHVGRALELLHRADAQAGVANAFTWYLSCMGRLATGQLPAALAAAQQSWQFAQQAEQQQQDGSKENLAAAAARLALPISALCKQLSAPPAGAPGGQLLQVAELAVEVAKAAEKTDAAAAKALGDALQRAADAADGREGAARLKELAASVPAAGAV